MRQPRPEDFDPTYSRPKPEQIDLSGVAPIKSKQIYSSHPLPSEKKLSTETPEVPKLVSSELPKSPTTELTDFRSYEVRNFDELRRLDTRITWEQMRYLMDVEEEIRRAMPEGERNNPEHRRITKNSIVRVLIEIARRLNLRVNASQFHNESDLLLAMVEKLRQALH